MPSPTDFNLSPYFDDFSESKKFHRVLFRPAFAVPKKGQAIRFEKEKVREMGRTARGVRGIKFKKEDDEVVGALAVADENQEVLSVSQKGFGKRTEVSAYRLTNRGGSGVIAMKLTQKTGDLVGKNHKKV
jgi:DNA gyrase subunit A